MCNSKRNTRFQCNRPPLLPPPERLLSLDSFVKALLAANDDVSERDVILVNDNAKSLGDNTALNTSTCRAHGQDLAQNADTMCLGSSSECRAAAASPRLPATKRKNLSRWDSGEAKPSCAGNKSLSGLCAPIRPKKSQDLPVVEPVIENDGPRSSARRRVRFALPTCTNSEVSPLLTKMQPITFTSKTCPERKMKAGSDIIPKICMEKKPFRKVTFAGVADMGAHNMDTPPRLVRSTFSLLESIFETSFSEMPSEDFSVA